MAAMRVGSFSIHHGDGAVSGVLIARPPPPSPTSKQVEATSPSGGGDGPSSVLGMSPVGWVSGCSQVFDPDRDPCYDVVGVGCDLVVGEPQDREPSRFQVRGAVGFVSPVVGGVVDFDDELGVEAGEVGDPGPDGDLAPESGAGSPVLDPAPESSFRDGEFVAEVPGSGVGEAGVFRSGHADTMPKRGVGW